MEPIIRLSHVSKTFGGEPSVQWKFWRTDRLRRAAKSVINDVSFDIFPGEKVALLGRNGAGKSTLLKMISRILQPDTGNIEVNGKVASLLELGIGFHPELTGAENIYFYGAMMGMHRHEVAVIFDDICDFAEIGEYINQPVKVYSSGMYQRLAFASAFAVRPDILIADEGLSVGDQAFQQKCLDRIVELTQQGTTILVVAHSISAVLRITDRGIWLDDGVVRQDGSVHEVAEAYSQHMSQISMQQQLRTLEAPKPTNPYILSTEAAQMPQIRVLSPANPQEWDRNLPLTVEATLHIEVPHINVTMAVRVVTASENTVVYESAPVPSGVLTLESGTHVIRATLPASTLRPSLYRVVMIAYEEHGLYRVASNGSLFLRVVDPHQTKQQEALLLEPHIMFKKCP